MSSPFNEAKYKALLEGLEMSEVNFINLYSIEDETFRFDSEHYQKKYREIIKIIKKKEYKKLSEIIESPVITGHTPSMKVDRFYGGNVKFIKTDNLRENKILGEFSHTLTEEGNQEIASSALKEGHIITTIIGATYEIIGRTSIIQKEILPANINQNIALIKPDRNLISPNYLNIYLNTSYGRNLLYWQSRQTGQVNLNCREVEKIYVPIFKILENYVEVIVDKIEYLKINAKQLYTQAENLLLHEIGLQGFTPSQEAVNIKSFKESFGSSGRLDAEYYQVKYEQIVEKIKSQKHSSLVHLVNISKSIEPGSAHYSDEKGLPFYRVSDYNKFGLSKPDKDLTNSFVTENKELIAKLKPKKGTILFSKDGSVGTAYLLREDLDGITSGAILHLKVKNTQEVLPEYLTLALNSQLVQMQAERDAGGSIILHWRVSEIENVVVPIIDYTKQQEIAELVEESFRLKTQSEQLLETAKRAVEIAIEESEEKALEYINKQIL